MIARPIGGISLGEQYRRRLLYENVAQRHKRIAAALAAPGTRDIVDDFRYKRGRGRLRALVRLRATFAEAEFE